MKIYKIFKDYESISIAYNPSCILSVYQRKKKTCVSKSTGDKPLKTDGEELFGDVFTTAKMK